MIFNKWKKVFTLSILIITLLLFSNGVTYAQTFTDVKDDYWAADYIRKVKNLGIINGYPDETFRPISEVTKVQALVMISRLYKLDDNIIINIKKKYQELLDELQVESWAQDGIAVALYSGIISEEVLKEYYKNGKAKMPATKEEICIFLTRAMGLEKEAKSKTIIVLPFKDAELIPAQVAPYVDMMIQKGIINEKGDSQGRFNPKSSMNRAMMAKVLSIAYDYIEENKVAQQIFSDIESEDKDTIIISGTIVSILKDDNEAYITIEDVNGQKNIYFVDANTNIMLDDNIIEFTDLVEGLIVKAKVTEKQRVISIEAKNIEEKYSGKVKSLILTTPTILTIEYEENGEYKVKSFYLDNNAKIILDDQETFIYKINEGDLVQLKIKNNKITEIIAESKEKHIKGIIKGIKYNPEPNLTIKDESGNLYEFPIGNKVKIKRNNKNAVITDLRNGDKVEIDVEYNVIIAINAEVLKSEDEGIIKAIFISSKPELTILNKDGEEVSYYISKNADIEIDGKKDSIYGLRLGYFAEIDIEGNEIVSMEIEPREQNDRYEGIVEYLNYDAGVIILSVNNYKTGEKENVRIDVIMDTSFIDSNGNKIKFKYLNVGDELIAIGNFDGGIFTAKAIIVTQSSR